MHMDLYYKDRDGKRQYVCQVGIYVSDYLNVFNEKRYTISIKPWFNIKNCLEYAMENPSRKLVEDLDSIQKLYEEYYSDKSTRFPQSKAYKSDDVELNQHKGIIIKEIRKQLREIAENHELLYNED